MSKLAQLKQWLTEQRHFSSAWFTSGGKPKPKEEVFEKLPDELSKEILHAINSLPTPSFEQDAVIESLNEAISRWRDNPERSNASSVILSHPISSVARILTDCLIDKHTKTLHTDLNEAISSVNVLDWVGRPVKVEEIKEKIKNKLGWDEEDFSEAEAGEQSNSDRRKKNSAGGNPKQTEDSITLAVIPNLGWCFLRCAEGLEGIDYLQEMLLNDKRQFWVIGSGAVGWEYLCSTLKLGAYCGEPIKMPSASGEQLQEWLTPIVEQFDIRFSNRAIHQRLQHHQHRIHADLSLETLEDMRSEISHEVSETVQSSLQSLIGKAEDDNSDQDEESSAKKSYFNRLANVSEGVSVVALQLFIASLAYRDVDTVESETQTVSAKAASEVDKPVSRAQIKSPEASSQADRESQLMATIPRLPPLPDLDQGDLYLLYSLMLHGDLTLRALAKSLGDAPQVVNNQVQVLRTAQVIEQKNGVIKINPVHYPHLRRELSRNNFIIEMS